jgi:hypothetical protein
MEYFMGTILVIATTCACVCLFFAVKDMLNYKENSGVYYTKQGNKHIVSVKDLDEVGEGEDKESAVNNLIRKLEEKNWKYYSSIKKLLKEN